MARELTDIYDDLIAEKNAQPTLNGLQPAIDSSQTLLNDLTSSSRVARWRLFIWIVAVSIWAHERLWDIAKVEMQAIADASHPGTVPWYQAEALKFQYGDALVDIDGVFQYASIDPTLQIIARSACIEGNGSLVLLKVAKLDGADVVPLTAPELVSFNAYIDEIKMAGTLLNVLTDVPDLLRVKYDIYYDPLVLNADGSLILDASVFPVEDAINNKLSNLPFNGSMVLTELTDAIQLANGVDNLDLQLATAKWGAFPHATINVEYDTHAGHIKIDPTYPLASEITYIPNGV